LADEGVKEVSTMYKQQSVIPSISRDSIPSELELQSLTGHSNNSRLDLAGSKQRVRVGNRGQGTLQGSVLGAAKVVVPLNGVAVVGGVEGLAGADELVGLDEDLGAVAGVDAVADVLEVAVVDVAGAEAEGGSTRVDVAPVVVGVRHAQVALVLIAVVVGVAHQGRLPVVVDVAVGDGHVVGGVGDLQLSVSLPAQFPWEEMYINQAVVVVLVVVTVRGDIDVVNPHIVGVFCHSLVESIVQRRDTYECQWHLHSPPEPS
jgi:hypothetical protein